MKISVMGALLDFDGNEVEKQTGRVEDGKPTVETVTFRSLFIEALNAVRPNQDPPADEKFTAYRLSMVIHDNDEVDLTAEDVKFLKEKAERICSPLGVGRVRELLAEPAESGPAGSDEESPAEGE